MSASGFSLTPSSIRPRLFRRRSTSLRTLIPSPFSSPLVFRQARSASPRPRSCPLLRFFGHHGARRLELRRPRRHDTLKVEWWLELGEERRLDLSERLVLPVRSPIALEGVMTSGPNCWGDAGTQPLRGRARRGRASRARAPRRLLHPSSPGGAAGEAGASGGRGQEQRRDRRAAWHVEGGGGALAKTLLRKAAGGTRGREAHGPPAPFSPRRRSPR
jgi:hypothetical protein